MGRAKEELARLQELESMYEWIRINYGYDPSENESEEWAEAVFAYEVFCGNYEQEENDWYEQDLLEQYAFNSSPVGVFQNEINSIVELLDVQVGSEAHSSLLVMFHGHIISSLEHYLASTFIGKVVNSNRLIRKLVESDPVFSRRNLTLKEIFEEKQKLAITVTVYLKDLIFHDLRKVKPLFRDVLGCDFGDVSWLFRAVVVRHDCVHRAGRDKEGNRVNLTVDSIRQLIEESSLFVSKIELDLMTVDIRGDMEVVTGLTSLFSGD